MGNCKTYTGDFLGWIGIFLENEKRAYIAWDMSELTGSVTDFVSARMGMSAADGEHNSLMAEISHVTDSWSESTVTWNNAPYIGSAIQTFDLEDIGRGNYSPGYSEIDGIDMTVFVQSWLAGTVPDDYGVAITGVFEGDMNVGRSFFSTEGDDHYEQYFDVCPLLQVKYRE